MHSSVVGECVLQLYGAARGRPREQGGGEAEAPRQDHVYGGRYHRSPHHSLAVNCLSGHSPATIQQSTRDIDFTVKPGGVLQLLCNTSIMLNVCDRIIVALKFIK
mmetsp:Transcript_30448/g.60595  ORF Transcript_30448/g.60595 Transcript_30448/m.60595 type:complete len:105 (+) Transcript_30448:2195-2509(+)